MPTPEALGAVVLAGGRSSRMGDDKAGLDWHGRPLVAYVAATLQALTDGGPVLVVGPAATPAWVAALPAGVRLLADAVPHLGPVTGLAAGLRALEGRASRALVTAADQPFVDRTTFAPLLAATPGTAAWHAAGHDQPLGAVYAVRPVDPGTRRLKDLLEDAVILPADARTAATLRSLDTPEAYAEALSRA